MRYNSSGFYEEKLSLLGIGTDLLPKNEKGEVEAEKGSALLKTAFERGVTLFFVPFSESESTKRFLGESFSRKSRDEYFLCGSIDAENFAFGEEIETFFEKQLMLLKCGYFDYFVIENINRKNYSEFVRNKIYDTFSKFKEYGKIKHLGFSFKDSVEFGKEILEKYCWDFAKFDLNFCNWEFSCGDDFYHVLRKKGVPFVASDPFMGGKILDPPKNVLEILRCGDPFFSMEEWALRWFFDKKGLLCIITSPENAEKTEKYANIISSSKTLNSSRKHYLKLAVQKLSEEKCEGTEI